MPTLAQKFSADALNAPFTLFIVCVCFI